MAVSLEGWSYVLEREVMKVSRRKTENMCMNDKETGGKMGRQGVEILVKDRR